MRRRLGWLVLVAAATAITGVAACRQIVGIQDNPATELTTMVCGLPYGTPTCASCASANCCSESSACAADGVCKAYESCLGRCNGDANCRSRCTIDHPVGMTSDVTTLSVCLATKCEDECGLGCGGLAGWQVEPDAAGSCQSCFATNACAQARACATSAGCDALNRCNLACSTVENIDCESPCELADGVDPAWSWTPGGDAGLWGAFTNVRNGQCEVACGTGGYWECVGSVGIATSNAATVTFHLTVKDFGSSAPVGGVDVDVCNLAETDCSAPIVTRQTDQAGQVTLSFQNTTNALAQSFMGLNGFVRITSPPGSPSIVPDYVYWAFPISEAELFALAEVVTPDEQQQLNSINGFSQDPKRGAVSLTVLDCTNTIAAGVRISLGPNADEMTHAVIPGVFGEATVTDGSGILIFSNVLTGPFTAEATPMATGKLSSKVQAFLRPNTVTSVYIRPTPLQ